MNADEKVLSDDFGLRQAKRGIVLARGERVVDCFDYDSYQVKDRINSQITVENSILLTNKRLVHARYSGSKKRISKRVTEIPVDRIECVNSFYKFARYLKPALIVIFAVLAFSLLAIGALFAFKVFPALIGENVDLILFLGLGVIFLIAFILSLVLPKKHIAFGITVYTKDNPETPFRVFNLSTKAGSITSIAAKREDCFTADITEAERMALDLSNEIVQVKIENEKEEEKKNGSDVG